MMMFWILASLVRGHAAPPFDCPSALEKFLVRPQPRLARLRVETNRSRGLSWRGAVDYQPHLDFDPRRLADDAARPEFSTTGSISDPFGARTLAFPAAHLNRRPDADVGTDGEARVFALYLTPAEVDAHLDGELPQPPRPRLVEAFAYLRYHVRDDRFVVTEIHSDVFPELEGARRDRYRAWDRTLLLSFERFVDLIRKDAPWSIVIAGPNHAARSGPGAARYRNLPVQLGYHGTYAWDRLDGGDPVGPALAFNSSIARAHEKSPLRAAAHDRIKFVTKNRATLARAEMNKATPRPVISTIATAPAGFAAPIPYTRFENELIYETEGQRRAHQRALNALPPWTGDFEETSLVSLARAAADEIVFDHVDLGPRRVAFEQWPDQDGEAALSLDDHPGSVTLRGFGRRSLEAPADLPPQVFAVVASARHDHPVAGGLTESAGLFEMQNHLHLLDVARRARVSAGVAIPLDLGWIERYPRVEGSKRTLVNVDAYTSHELGEAPERLVQARYYARAGTRVSVVARTIARGTPKEMATWLSALLQQTYSAFEMPLDMPQDDSLEARDPATIGLALDHVRAANGSRPESMLRQWAERSLATLGLVHGIGGHLGGLTRARNISLAGEVRDLDERVYLPDHPARAFAEDPAGTEAGVPTRQREDLHNWMEAYYWMRLLLIGETDAPGGVAYAEDPLGVGLQEPEFEGDEPQQEFARREFHRAQSVRFDGPDGPVIKDSHLDDVYRSARAAGRLSREARAE